MKLRKAEMMSPTRGDPTILEIIILANIDNEHSNIYKNMKSLLLLVTLPLIFCAQKVIQIELTDDNFEHDTQASTGATTGDWFVRFCDTKCTPELDKAWSKLSTSLARRVSIASVDLYVININFSL